MRKAATSFWMRNFWIPVLAIVAYLRFTAFRSRVKEVSGEWNGEKFTVPVLSGASDDMGDTIIKLSLGILIAASILPQAISSLIAVDTGEATVDKIFNVVAPIVIAVLFIYRAYRESKSGG